MPDRPELDPADDLGRLEAHSIDEILAPILARGGDDPVAPPAVPAAEIESELAGDLPGEGSTLREVLAEVDRAVVAHSRRNAHPGFFGYVCGPGLPTDPLAHALVAALNQNVTSFSSAPGAVTLERRVVDWLTRLAGLPEGAGGAILSGGSIANLTAVAVALHATMGPELRRHGLAALEGGPPILYVSSETHFCAVRAGIVLGLGMDHVRTVPTDAERRMLPEALAGMIDDDRAAGARPFAVVATAGTTTTGANDPLDAIADVAAARGVRLHVDAAYGGAMLLSDELRPRLAGIERANSVVVDLHKWLYTAFDGSALLFRDPREARELFFARTDYIRLPREGGPEEFAFFHHGPETSKRLRALPFYVALRRYGAARLGRNVLHQVRVAEHLSRLVEEAGDLELVAAPQTAIVAFRHSPPGRSAREVDRLAERIRERLLAEGRFYLSETILEGRPVLRVCVQSHATRAEHVEGLIAAVRRLGAGL